MPKTVTTNPDINHSFIRPLVFDIARQVLVWTGQSPEIPILFAGESEVAYQPNSTIEVEKRQVRLPSDAKFFIECEEDYDADQIYNVAVLHDENQPYFNDRALGIRLAPVYVPAIIRLSFKLREVDSNVIRRWRDAMRIQIAQKVDYRMHQASYYYLVPTEYQRMLESFHELKESNAPYGETLKDWWKRCCLDSVTELVTMGGSQPSLVVRETASRIMGQFDFDVPDKGNKENETSAHSIAFTYIVRCDIPLATQAVYPPAIHQKVINAKYIPRPENLEPDWVASRGSVFSKALRYFEKAKSNAPVRDTGYRIPWFNDYRLIMPPPSGHIVLSALVSLEFDENGVAKPLLNFKDLKGVVYTEDWLSLLKAEHKYINMFTASPLYVVVAENNRQLHHSCYEVTENLDVFLKGGSPRNLYHVALYILRDPTIVFEPGRLTNANDLDTYVAAACPGLLESKKYPVPFDGTYTTEQVRWIFDQVRKCNASWSQYLLPSDAQIGNLRVGQFTVEVGRKE